MKRNINYLVLLLIIVTSIFAQLVVPLDARLRGGRIHFQGGRYEKALEQFALALKDFPANAEARFWKAMALEKLGNFNEAAANFDTTYSIAPEWIEKTQKDPMFQYTAANAFLKAGQILEKVGNTRSAIIFYSRATFIDITNPQVFVYLAQAFSTIDSIAGIRSVAENLLKFDSLNPQVPILLGKFYFKKQNWDSSLTYYERSIRIFDNSQAQAKKRLGMELKFDDAKTETVASALIEKFDTKAIESYINDSLKAKSKFPQIAKIANELYLTNALLSSSYFYYGSSAIQKANSIKVESLQRKYLNTAGEYFTRVIQFNLYDYDASFNLGLTKYRSGNDAVADSIFRSIASKSMISLKAISDSISNKILSMISMGNIANGYFEITGPIVNNLDKELAKNTFYTGFWYLYFSSLKNSKTTPSAADKDKISVSGLDPSAIEELFLFLGATETSLKKYDDAIKVFYTVIELNPKNLDAYRNLAVCYREKGDQQKSYEIFQQYEKLKKEQK